MNINCTLSYTLGRKHFCLKLFIVDIKVTNVSFVLLKISSKQSCTDQQQKKISLIIGCPYLKGGTFRRTEICCSHVMDVRKRVFVRLLLLVLKMKKQISIS